MKPLAVLLTVLVVSFASLAEPAALTPTQRLEQQSAQAQALYDKHAFVEAAVTLEKAAADPQIAGLPVWSDKLYTLARYQARAGKADAALVTLKYAVDIGAVPPAGDVVKEADLASLHDRQQFKDLIARLEKETTLWKDNAALATPYKPVLSEEEKVAGLSKLWSEARFNFPFFGRIPDVDWDAQYMAFLPRVRAAQTTEDYYRVLMRFLATLKDGHTRVIAPNELHGRFYGVTAVNTRLVEGKVVVIGASDPTLEAQGIKTGAEIISIDGKPTLDYAKAEVEPFVFGFTPQDRNVWLYGYQLLRGPATEPVRLVLRNADGKTVSIAVPRHKNTGHFGFLPELDLAAHFRMLPGNIAYLQVNVFADDSGAKTLRENFAAISAANSLIIDVRDNGGGSSDNAYALLKILASKPFNDSNWRTRDYKAAWRSWGVAPGWTRIAASVIDPDSALHYAKPVVVLTSARTYSAAEDFVVAFLSMHRGKLVGETTGGSTGNPMLLKLPGGGMSFICTKDDSFPDGRVFEGVGIAPDVAVSPTVADIRAGRDPVLTRAVALLRTGK